MRQYHERREQLQRDQAEIKARRLARKPAPPDRHTRPAFAIDRHGRPDWSHMSPSERLRSQVRSVGACIEWTGYRCEDGYGRTFIGRKRWNVHRLSWVLHHGAITAGLVVRHTCDNPPCVRIEHLRLGTQRDNVRDRDRKGRGKVPVRAENRWTGEVMPSSRRRRRAERSPSRS